MESARGKMGRRRGEGGGWRGGGVEEGGGGEVEGEVEEDRLVLSRGREMAALAAYNVLQPILKAFKVTLGGQTTAVNCLYERPDIS